VKKNLLLWTGVLGGPIIWLVSFEAKFSLAPWACSLQWKPALFGVAIVALIMTACIGMLSWRQWQRIGAEAPGEGEGPISRMRLMAMGGVILSAFCCLLIIAQTIPEIILGACE
jgi:hypothetical protein